MTLDRPPGDEGILFAGSGPKTLANTGVDGRDLSCSAVDEAMDEVDGWTGRNRLGPSDTSILATVFSFCANRRMPGMMPVQSWPDSPDSRLDSVVMKQFSADAGVPCGKASESSRC